MQFKKLSDTQIEITKPIQATTIKYNYDRKFIENQIIQITKQRDDLMKIKDEELLECQTILNEMDKLGIVTEKDINIRVNDVV